MVVEEEKQEVSERRSIKEPRSSSQLGVGREKKSRLVLLRRGVEEKSCLAFSSAFSDLLPVFQGCGRPCWALSRAEEESASSSFRSWMRNPPLPQLCSQGRVGWWAVSL
jgi:hypothetical protein